MENLEVKINKSTQPTCKRCQQRRVDVGVGKWMPFCDRCMRAYGEDGEGLPLKKPDEIKMIICSRDHERECTCWSEGCYKDLNNNWTSIQFDWPSSPKQVREKSIPKPPEWYEILPMTFWEDFQLFNRYPTPEECWNNGDKNYRMKLIGVCTWTPERDSNDKLVKPRKGTELLPIGYNIIDLDWKYVELVFNEYLKERKKVK